MKAIIPDTDVAMHLSAIDRFVGAAGLLAWRGKDLVETREAVHGTR
jgi:hypothetical protein